MRRHWANAFALLWGFAEATVFFIVPDVLLSWLALRRLRPALVACLFALSGALVGGIALWFLAQQDAESLRALFTRLPAIDSGMIDDVRSRLETDGLAALLMGPLIGTPYKIYALEAADMNLGFWAFLSISVPARFVRFALVSIVVSWLSRLLSLKLTLRQRQVLLVVCWLGFYSWYFLVMSGVPQAVH